MSDPRIKVRDTDLDLGSEAQPVALAGTKRGEMFVMNFYTRMLFQGRCFNVRAGTISVPLDRKSVV